MEIEITFPHVAIQKLRSDVTRWKSELSGGWLRGTLLTGVVGKAVSALEQILFEIAKYYIAFCERYCNFQIQAYLKAKKLDKLTMGQLIGLLKDVNGYVTYYYRSQSVRGMEWLKERDLIDQSTIDQLKRVLDLRNQFIHHQDDFMRDQETALANTQEVLIQIYELLSELVFNRAIFDEQKEDTDS